MEFVKRDVTIPLLFIGFLMVFVQQAEIAFNVYLLIGAISISGLMLYWVFSSPMMVVISSLISGNAGFLLIKYGIVLDTFEVMCLIVVVSGVTALGYNVFVEDETKGKTEQGGIFQPAAFIAFGLFAYLGNAISSIF